MQTIADSQVATAAATTANPTNTTIVGPPPTVERLHHALTSAPAPEFGALAPQLGTPTPRTGAPVPQSGCHRTHTTDLGLLPHTHTHTR